MHSNDVILLNNLADSYKILAEDEELCFNVVINQITDEIEQNYQVYEVDHVNKVIYLELKQNRNSILIVSNDDLELPLAIVRNLNEAAKFMNVTATHLYRAYRNAGRPERLAYNKYILIKNVI